MLDLLLLSFFHVHVILGADNPLLPIAVSFKFIHLVDMSDRAFEVVHSLLGYQTTS